MNFNLISIGFFFLIGYQWKTTDEFSIERGSLLNDRNNFLERVCEFLLSFPRSHRSHTLRIYRVERTLVFVRTLWILVHVFDSADQFHT